MQARYYDPVIGRFLSVDPVTFMDTGEPYSWVLADDFENKVLSLESEKGRSTGLKLLSLQTLDAQLGSHGATWLDRVQIPFDEDGIGK